MKPHLTIRGVHELRATLEKPDPGSPVTHIISLWDSPARESEQAEINHYLGLFGLRLPGVPVLPLEFEDISAPVEGLTAPAPAHMTSVLAFARMAIAERADDTHLLVHCRMGVSRSTACGLAILAQSNPKVSSSDLFSHLLSLRAWLAPNQRLIRFADEILGRDDPLLSAVVRHWRRDTECEE
jgi:predicted protein tyrosine phosphatase